MVGSVRLAEHQALAKSRGLGLRSIAYNLFFFRNSNELFDFSRLSSHCRDKGSGHVFAHVLARTARPGRASELDRASCRN